MQFAHDPDNETFCAHPGCGERIVCSADGTVWQHWPDAAAPLSIHSLAGGRHQAVPPEGT